MFNTYIIRTVLTLLSLSRIIFTVPVPDDYSDNIIPLFANSKYEDYSEEIISTSTITHTSPEPEDFTTELQNVPVCETTDQWAECELFLETHLNKGTKGYGQLQSLKYFYGGLASFPLPLPTIAAIIGYTELIQLLLRNGVPINKKYTSLEETMLHDAAKHGKDDLVIWLLTQGAEINVENWNSNTPLHLAASHFWPNTVKLLLDAGAYVNVTNKDEETPLFHAVKYLIPGYFQYSPNRSYDNSKEIIKLLLEHGADTNIANNLRTTPLHFAARIGSLTIVKLLIDRGANINATDVNNQTPLHKATESNNVSVVENLVTMGCDKTITDTLNRTALDIAKERNFNEIVDLLSREN